MSEEKVTKLQHKVEDYRRFAFILIALAGFLMIGTVIPSESVQIAQEWLIVFVSILLAGAVLLHGVSLKTEKLILEDE
jgi:hypothetical protein